MSIVSLYNIYDQVTQAIFSRILQFLKIHFAWVWASICYILSLMEVILFIFYILSMFVAYDFLHHPFTIYQVEPHAFSIPISIPNGFSIWRILHGVWFGGFFPFFGVSAIWFHFCLHWINPFSLHQFRSFVQKLLSP